MISRKPMKKKEAKKEKIAKDEGDPSQSNQVLKSYLKKNVNDHYNYENAVDYKVSSGSLTLDTVLGGGFGPGLMRFIGINEGGKTSEALEVMKNFLNTVPNGKGVYIKAEGRLSKDMVQRSGVKFVFDEKGWDAGVCFVYESNIFESAFGLMKDLIKNNPEGVKYCFVVDSTDALITKGDYLKEFDSSQMVAGGAKLTTWFLKGSGVPLSKRGHLGIFISQVREHVATGFSDQSTKKLQATGGNALLHHADWILEFRSRNKNDIIFGKPKTKENQANEKDNPPIGHIAKIIIRKSTNETTNISVKYPVKYGRKDGNSIWVEKEIIDALIGWALIEKKGAWIKASEDFLNMMNEFGVEFPESIQGEAKLLEYLEKNKDLLDYLKKYFADLIYSKE